LVPSTQTREYNLARLKKHDAKNKTNFAERVLAGELSTDAGRRAAIAVRRRNGKDSALDRFEADAKERQRLRRKGTPKVEYLGEAAEQAATMFLVGKQYVYDAKRVREADSALLEQVIEGELSLQDALDELATGNRNDTRGCESRTWKEASASARLRARPTSAHCWSQTGQVARRGEVLSTSKLKATPQ
jgi:hypothetical protein